MERKPLPKRNIAFEKWARNVIKKYQSILLLDRHDIELEADNEVAYFECVFRPPYLDNLIRYNPEKVLPDWNDKKIEDLKHALIHELCHIITDPLYGNACDRYITKEHLNETRETVTDHISRIITKLEL